MTPCLSGFSSVVLYVACGSAAALLCVDLLSVDGVAPVCITAALQGQGG